MSTHTTTIGIVGARGYVGRELIALLENHDGFDLRFAGSRRLAGTPVDEHLEGVESGLEYRELDPRDVVARDPDACVLALPNEVSPPFVEAIDDAGSSTLIVDLSSDHRFDEAWQYGQPERFRTEIASARRIANPGCYATGAQLAIAPFLDVLGAPPRVFGVSGYSGAGTSPSPRNDTDELRDNLMPYKLTGHTHERELGRHLGRDVHFTPHVAEFFRGISLTVSLDFEEPRTREELHDRLRRSYAEEPLVETSDSIPLVRDNAGEHDATIGGLQLAEDGSRAVLVATLDNLLKGAATQALQNLNLACDYEEWEGIPT